MTPAARTPEGGYIGAPIPRREDARLLTGRGIFVDDLEMPGVAHAAMVRSPTPTPACGASTRPPRSRCPASWPW